MHTGETTAVDSKLFSQGPLLWPCMAASGFRPWKAIDCQAMCILYPNTQEQNQRWLVAQDGQTGTWEHWKQSNYPTNSGICTNSMLVNGFIRVYQSTGVLTHAGFSNGCNGCRSKAGIKHQSLIDKGCKQHGAAPLFSPAAHSITLLHHI